jgi:ankyrin repeat protein
MQLLLAAHDPAAQAMAADKNGLNALMVAAKLGNIKCVELLLELPCAKEQVEASDKEGRIALMHALHEGHSGVVKVGTGFHTPGHW